MDERKPRVHVELSLDISSPKVSLSQPPSEPTQAIVTARIAESERPHSAITINVDKTPLDGGHNGHHDALFRSAFSLRDVADESRRIMLSPPVRVNYGSSRDNNIRKIPFMHFHSIPAKGQGKLTVKHDLTLERLFLYEHYPSAVKREEVKPGDKFRLQMQNPEWVQWWAFGDLDGDLRDKKFIWNWEPPETMEDWLRYVLVDGQTPDVEMLKRDGWVFSQPRMDLKFSVESDEGVVLEFTE